MYRDSEILQNISKYQSNLEAKRLYEGEYTPKHIPSKDGSQ